MKNLALSKAERSEWSQSWQIPVIAAIGMMMAASPYLTMGTLMTAIQEDTGWTRLQISSGTGILGVIMVVMSPVMGHIIDRFGSRRIGLPGLAMYCLALASLALAGTTQWTWWIGWVLVAVSALFIKSTVWTAAVISWFTHSRGLAIAVALSGSGMASFALPMILTLLQQSWGWQGAYIGLACIFAILSLPAAWLYFFDATDQKRRDKTLSAAPDRSILPGLSPRESFRSRRFIQIASACLLIGIAIGAVNVHFISILQFHGISQLAAAGIFSGIGLSAFVGRLCTGYLLDRFKGPLIGLITFSLPAIACMILLTDISASIAFGTAILIGFSAGAEFDVMAYLTARYFGVRHYGLIFGTIVGLLSCGVGLGPMLGAHMFDHFGDYQNMLLTIGPIFLLSGLLIGTLGPYPDHPTSTSAKNKVG